jgi:hypothetical protein
MYKNVNKLLILNKEKRVINKSFYGEYTWITFKKLDFCMIIDASGPFHTQNLSVIHKIYTAVNNLCDNTVKTISYTQTHYYNSKRDE